MIHISDLFDPAELESAIESGHIRQQTHPGLPLAILNYTETCQFERAWTDVTLQCRGLIYDVDTEEVIARPFRKFFNYGEAGPLGETVLDPDEPVIVTDKIDGSLGILYEDGAGGAIATRGSFTSEQAQHATEIWKSRYAPTVTVAAEITYLFEIVYPGNRIVCDYGGTDDLILLAAVHKQTGDVFRHLSHLGWPGPVVTHFAHRTLAEALSASPRDGAEGLVVDFVNRDERVKIKQDDYVALHRIVTGCTARRLWEHLAVHACHRHGGSELLVRRLMMSPERVGQILAAGPDWRDRFLRDVPEEFGDWVTMRISDLEQRVERCRAELLARYSTARSTAGDDRKAFALLVKDHPQSGALFSLRQDREIDTFLWRTVRPEHELPYKHVDEAVA